jgi:hypothetical protein
MIFAFHCMFVRRILVSFTVTLRRLSMDHRTLVCQIHHQGSAHMLWHAKLDSIYYRVWHAIVLNLEQHCTLQYYKSIYDP